MLVLVDIRHQSGICQGQKIMRIYYYCTETGIYQGEGFQEDYAPAAGAGITAIAPPPYEKGEVAVYDADAGCWTLLKVRRQESSPMA